MANTKWTSQYEELGGVDQKKKFYSEGDEIIHPSGIQYVRRGGRWCKMQEGEPSKLTGTVTHACKSEKGS